MNDRDITPIGITNFRNQSQPFGIRDIDRLGHIYAIGKTGVGKSTLLQNMAISDIRRGNGLAIIDPHGDLAKNILDYIPEHRIKDVIYFNPSDLNFPIGFNPLKGVHPTYHHLVASGLIGTMKKIWADSWGPRMEHILRFSLLTLMHYPDATLLDIQPLLTDEDYRSHLLSYVKEDSILLFWTGEFDKYNKAFKSEVIAPILNKVGLFSASLPLKYTVGQKVRSFRMQEVMDGKKILIANLSKGLLGEEASGLLGCILITSMQMAALYRAKQLEQLRIPFYLYIDEMHSFVTQSFANILAEARKYGLSLFLTHQFIDQLDERIRKAIFGNAGTIIAFRVGANDAEYLEQEFKPVLNQEDLVNLAKYSFYIKLMIDGATSRPFSAVSQPIHQQTTNLSQKVVENSKSQYSKPRIEVEASLKKRVRQESINRTLF